MLDGQGKNCSVSTELEPVNSNLALLFSFLICLLIGIIIQAVIFCSKKGYLDPLKEKWNQFLAKLGFEVRLLYPLCQEGSTIFLILVSGWWQQWESCWGRSISSWNCKEKGEIFGHVPWNHHCSHDLCKWWRRRILLYGACHLERTLCCWFGIPMVNKVTNILETCQNATPKSLPYRFIWIMGFCIPMGIRSSIKRKIPLTVQLWTILKRSVKLFLLGFFWSNVGMYTTQEYKLTLN